MKALTTLKLTSASSSATRIFAQRGFDILFCQPPFAAKGPENVLEARAEGFEHYLHSRGPTSLAAALVPSHSGMTFAYRPTASRCNRRGPAPRSLANRASLDSPKRHGGHSHSC